MQNLSGVTENKDLATKEYVDSLMSGEESSVAHYEWGGQTASFTTQYNISITNTSSSIAEKAYVKKLGSFSFTQGSAPNFFVNMLTTGMDLTAALSVSSGAAVYLFISTTNYTGTNLTTHNSLVSDNVWSNSLNVSSTGTGAEFVMARNNSLSPNTTYYVYVSIYAKLSATSGAFKLQTPKVYLQSCYRTTTTTNKTGLKKRIFARVVKISSSYYSTGKHRYELNENVDSFMNCFVIPSKINSPADTIYYMPVIAGPIMVIVSDQNRDLVSPRNIDVSGERNVVLGHFFMVEEYY